MGKVSILGVMCLAAVASHSQTVPPDKLFEKPCNEEMANDRVLQARTLDQLHAILRECRDPHDAYLSVAEIGNEGTVPLPLERYRLDYGASEPVLPRGVHEGFICTRFHLVDALRTITNTDQGIYYPRWAVWWKANKGFSQHQWILNGFTEQGLHVSEPMDERFALELIEVMGRGFDDRGFVYRAANAGRLLANERPELRAGWVERASASEQRLRRLGVVAVLSRIETTGHEDILRRLAADSDMEIRSKALALLNSQLP
jgi:hypothetical protein